MTLNIFPDVALVESHKTSKFIQIESCVYCFDKTCKTENGPKFQDTSMWPCSPAMHWRCVIQWRIIQVSEYRPLLQLTITIAFVLISFRFDFILLCLSLINLTLAICLELFLLPAGDSMSMMDKDVLDRATVLWATTVYSVANLNEMLPRTGDYPFTSTSTRVASSPVTLLLTLAATAAVSLVVFRLNWSAIILCQQ